MYSPPHYNALLTKVQDIGFTMPSDIYVGALLKTLVGSKAKANLLELGTGAGLSLSWIVAGMDKYSHITTIDNDSNLIAIVDSFFKGDKRITTHCEDGGKWIDAYDGQYFDLIFADTWAGKYTHLEETLDLLKVGGLYIIDDMNPQSNWPDGHEEKAKQLINYLQERADFNFTYLDYATGIVIMSRKNL